jgi:hypothetical protein
MAPFENRINLYEYRYEKMTGLIRGFGRGKKYFVRDMGTVTRP